ncbi:zinc-binding loop region of homing endonuclease-domain-containing protein [Lipomyces kononenkoae]
MDAKLNNVTLTRANELVKSYHYRTTSLECWESNHKPHHGGYPIVFVTAGAIAFSACLHQIALIADNRRDELELTLGNPSFDVSHLCHNRLCFNAEHLVVESRQTNVSRMTCNGKKILVHDEFSYHPCSHGSVEKMRKCILPVQHLEEVTMPNSEAQASTGETAAPIVHDVAFANRLDSITPVMAQQLVDRYHVATAELGCWESNLKQEKKGSCRVLIWKLKLRVTVQQLTLIASDRRDELKRSLGTRGSYYSVSNLCLNLRCFNPEHVIVESNSDCQRRKSCNGKKIVVHEGVTDHPCVHGDVNGLHKCILPVERRQGLLPNSEENGSTDATAPDPNGAVTNDDGADAGTINSITPMMAKELLDKYRALTTELGCWESNLKACHGYCSIRLRRLRTNPFLHQLALIADGRSAELKMTLDSHVFDVSHLCHNGKCFNPGHLIVESRQNNLRRKVCAGHRVVLYRDLEHNPCLHGEVEKMRKCILPLLRLEAGHHVNGSV